MASVSPWLLEDGVLHLNHGSFGATPASVLEAQERVRRRMEANPTRYFVGDEYQHELDSARRVVADFVGADEAGLVFVNNATTGVNAVMRSLEPSLAPGDEILGHRPRIQRLCERRAVVSAERTGAQVVFAQAPFPLESSQQIVDAVLGAVTDRTRVLLIDSVTSATGLVMPVARARLRA